MKKSVKLTLVATLAITMAACSTFRGPRAIDPKDDSQFENLPPAPAVEAIPATPEEAAAPATVAESAPEAPETGSANLGNPIEGSVIEAQPVAASAAPTTNTTSSLNDLLKIRVFYFGTNLSDITSLSYGGLNAHAQYLKGNAQAKLQIGGHTDERGTREYNLALGERRANAVARYLVGLGVTADQLSVVSYGKEKPAADGSDDEAWAKNRRVELDYTAQ
ncbi:MAG: peptidoglycan-associated lipoprotein Pal [Pseudomonadota bacterium]